MLRTRLCRNGRWKEPWEKRSMVPRLAGRHRVPLRWCDAATVRGGYGRARRGRVRQEQRSLAQSLGGLGLMPLGHSPRLVPSFTGTQSVVQAFGDLRIRTWGCREVASLFFLSLVVTFFFWRKGGGAGLKGTRWGGGGFLVSTHIRIPLKKRAGVQGGVAC